MNMVLTGIFLAVAFLICTLIFGSLIAKIPGGIRKLLGNIGNAIMLITVFLGTLACTLSAFGFVAARLGWLAGIIGGIVTFFATLTIFYTLGYGIGTPFWDIANWVTRTGVSIAAGIFIGKWIAVLSGREDVVLVQIATALAIRFAMAFQKYSPFYFPIIVEPKEKAPAQARIKKISKKEAKEVAELAEKSMTEADTLIEAYKKKRADNSEVDRNG